MERVGLLIIYTYTHTAEGDFEANLEFALDSIPDYILLDVRLYYLVLPIVRAN